MMRPHWAIRINTHPPIEESCFFCPYPLEFPSRKAHLPLNFSIILVFLPGSSCHNQRLRAITMITFHTFSIRLPYENSTPLKPIPVEIFHTFSMGLSHWNSILFHLSHGNTTLLMGPSHGDTGCENDPLLENGMFLNGRGGADNNWNSNLHIGDLIYVHCLSIRFFLQRCDALPH